MHIAHDRTFCQIKVQKRSPSSASWLKSDIVDRDDSARGEQTTYQLRVQGIVCYLILLRLVCVQ
jgi:hypothetical protein